MGVSSDDILSLSHLSLGFLLLDSSLNCLKDVISLGSLEGEGPRARGAAATRFKGEHYLVSAIASQQSVGPEKEWLQDLTLCTQSQKGQLLSFHPQYVGALQAAAFRSLGLLRGYPELGSFPGGAVQRILQHLQGRKT